jgi:hypothetical protein
MEFGYRSITKLVRCWMMVDQYYTVKKVVDFPVPARREDGMSLTKLSLAGNN